MLNRNDIHRIISKYQLPFNKYDMASLNRYLFSAHNQESVGNIAGKILALIQIHSLGDYKIQSVPLGINLVNYQIKQTGVMD